MLHQLALTSFTTRGSTTCQLFKVMVSLPAQLTPKQQIVGQLHFHLHIFFLFISVSVFHSGPNRRRSLLPELQTGVQGECQLQPQLDGWKDEGSDGRREGWEDYLEASARNLTFGILASKAMIQTATQDDSDVVGFLCRRSTMPPADFKDQELQLHSEAYT